VVERFLPKPIGRNVPKRELAKNRPLLSVSEPNLTIVGCPYDFGDFNPRRQTRRHNPGWHR
jgi:hypothetical protein